MSKIQTSKTNIIHKIQNHGKEVQRLVNKYLIPSYISRLGIKPEEREFYAKVEDVLDTQSAFNPKFETNSYVRLIRNRERSSDVSYATRKTLLTSTRKLDLMRVIPNTSVSTHVIGTWCVTI